MSKGTKTILIIIAIWVAILLGIVIIKNVSKNDKTAEVPEVAEENTVEDNTIEEEYVQKLTDGTKLNTSDELKEEKKLGELIVKDIQLTEKGDITKLLANLENPTSTRTEEKKVKVEILDKQGKVITTLKGIIDPVEANGKAQLNIAVTADVSNAYDFRISER